MVGERMMWLNVEWVTSGLMCREDNVVDECIR